jgi:hypothetical protein
MNNSALEAYLAGVDAPAAPIVVALAKAVRKAHPDFDVAIKYRILMYALRRNWRTWVCAIDARKKSVGLRFLYGVLLDDPRRVLRAGSSVLKTWTSPLTTSSTRWLSAHTSWRPSGGTTTTRRTRAKC